ncbi:MAG: SurA N-terminal domain-containing protein [Nocardioidaceae bacterium]
MVLRRVGVAGGSAVLLSALLAACGGLHTGDAAVVGDQVVTREQHDAAIDTFCAGLGQLQQAQAPEQGVPVRRAASASLEFLVQQTALDQIAENEEITPTKAEIKEYVKAIEEQIPPEAGAVTAELRKFFGEVARTQVMTLKLGEIRYQEENPGEEVPAQSQEVFDLGQQAITAHLKQVGYETDSRYGTIPQAAEEKPGTGSLSIAVSDEGIRGLDVPEGGTPTDAESC